MSSTSSKKMSSNFKDRSRNLALKVKESFKRSRPPSGAPTPVPDDSSVGPTQGGNNEGALPTNVAEEYIQTSPEWDGWQVDESSVAELKTWFDEHGETKWAMYAGKVDEALKSQSVVVLRELIALIPPSPFPVKSLADGLFDLIKLVVQIPGTKQDAYDFACQTIKLIDVLVDVFRKNPSNCLEESWSDFKGVRDAVTNICKWANKQVRKTIPNAYELGELVKKFDVELERFKATIILSIRAEQAAEKQMNEIKEKLAGRVANGVRYEQQNKAFCAPNTRVGILKELESWATEPSDDQHICWIVGIPGSGKSTIAATIARRLKECDVLRAQYFVSRNAADTTVPQWFFPTIAQQLAESPAAARVIHKELKTKTRTDTLAKDQAEALLLQPIKEVSRSSGTLVIVIDALDELQSAGKEDVPHILSGIASQLPSNVKLIITSRPENPIVTALKAPYTVTLDPKDSIPEINGFISSELKAIGEKQEWQPEEWPSKIQIQDLSAKAAGLFHYAVTAVRWIAEEIEKDGVAARDRVFDDVGHLGVANLEALYEFILNTWLMGRAREKPTTLDSRQIIRSGYFRLVIGRLVVLQQPLSIGGIISLFDIPEKKFDMKNFFRQMRSVLIPGGDSFTEDLVPRMHKSFRDYICSHRSPKEFQIYEHEAHVVSWKDCLSVVVKAQDSGPAYRYACTQWWRHLELTYEEEPPRDSDITNMLVKLQDSLIRAAWYNRINILNAFIALAKVGWAGMKKFGIDDLHKCLDTILDQLKVCE